VQVQRGVGTSTNGAGAFGGSVNILTDAYASQAYGGLSTSVGSYNTWKHTVKAGTGLLRHGFFVEGRASYISSEGYVDRASSQLWSYYLTAGWSHKRALIRFIHFNGHEKTYQSWYGLPQDSLTTNRRYNAAGTEYGAHLPAYYNQTDNYGQRYFQLVYDQGFAKHLALHAVAFATLGNGYYEEYKVGQDLSRYLISDSASTTADVIRRLQLRNSFYGGLFSLQYADHKHWDITLGGMYARYNGNNFGTAVWAQGVSTPIDPDKTYYASTSTKNDANIYVKVSYSPHRKINLFADMQYRYVGHRIAGNDSKGRQLAVDYNWHFFNPKVGVSVPFMTAARAYVSYALANREPARDDIIENLAAASPKPERLHDIELGLDLTRNSIQSRGYTLTLPIHLNGYYMYYVDQLVLTGRLNDVGNPIRTNIAESYRTGVELSGGLTLTKPQLTNPILTIKYSLSYNLSKLNTYNEYIPAYDASYTPVASAALVNTYSQTDIAFSPRLTGYGEIAVCPARGLELSWSIKGVSRQYLDNTQDDARSLRAYWFSNVRAAYTYHMSTRSYIRVSLLVNNLFDQHYESNGYTYRERYVNTDGTVTSPVHYNYYYPQAGTQVFLGMDLMF
jgi:iron complex outermembrane recepter protein